jgi:tRNA (guanine37-N1)-methyltransferase
MRCELGPYAPPYPIRDLCAFNTIPPLRIDILTALPRLLDSYFNESILDRAQKKGLVSVHVHDLREFSTDKHKRLDDYAFGGGAGMVMMIDPIFRCIQGLKAERSYDEVIYMSPDGDLLDQPMANRMSSATNLMLLCGHYKGVDERVRQHLITREVSIGNYVLSGGELPAAVLSDSLIRLLPGVLNDETSALSDSFQDGLLAPPVYTRPADYQGWTVPDVLMSGHEAKIHAWRHEQSVQRTQERRPGLLENSSEG